MLTIGAGLAWAIPLPALYILNSFSGSRLKPSTTLLAALVTTSWGGLALLASVPINWLFSTAVPELPMFGPAAAHRIVIAVNLLVFAGVGVSMADVFSRVMERLEPASGRQPSWVLVLVVAYRLATDLPVPLVRDLNGLAHAISDLQRLTYLRRNSAMNTSSFYRGNNSMLAESAPARPIVSGAGAGKPGTRPERHRLFHGRHSGAAAQGPRRRSIGC